MTTQLTMNGALARLLTEYRSRTFCVLLNSGNRGDGVTHMGGRQFLANLGITAREVREKDDLSRLEGDVLLIHGAGAMSRGSRSLKRLMNAVAPRFSAVVLLPTTFQVEDPHVQAFAESWDNRYHVFCRELVSFGDLQKARVMPKSLLLGHDLAFHADLGPWLARVGEGSAGIFRRDEHAAYGRLPKNFDHCVDAASGNDREPERLLDFIAQFSEIHTDRSHAAIVAARLRRKVVLYRNRDFKNQAVYDHSLAGMPHVRFVRRTPFSLTQFSRVVYWRRVKPVKSRVRRLILGPASSPA